MGHEQDMEPGKMPLGDDEDAKLDAALASVAAMERDEDAKDADAAWQNFQAKLAAHEPEVDLGTQRLRPSAKPAARTSIWRRIKTPSTGLGWLATAQAAAIAAMAFVLIPAGTPTQPDEYQVLSSDDPAVAAAPTGDAVLIFEADVTSTRINATLTTIGARIVDGPMANGGYVIQIEEGVLDEAIEELRVSEGVALVETLRADAQAVEAP
jgi:hypothetical protein